MRKEKIISKLFSNIDLLPLKKEYAHFFVEYINHPDVMKYTLSVPNPYQLSDAVSWISFAQEQEEKYGMPYNYGIFHMESGELIGNIGRLNNSAEQKHKDEIGYWIAHKHWNKGYMTEALSRFIPILRNEHGLDRIEARVFEGNEASARVLLKHNFKYEGKSEKYFKKKGKYITSLNFARVF